MDSQTLQTFIDQAETYLPIIRSGILVCSQEGNSGGELETSLQSTRAIKEAALAAGFDNIGQSGARLEQEFKKIVGPISSLSDVQTRGLLDKLAQLEVLLAKLQFSADDFSINLESLVDQSFLELGFESYGENSRLSAPENGDAAESADQNEFEGFEIDEEMIEIFAMEADDLLRSINTHLEVLKSAPDNRESLLEIRRNAHTLKGSAGIVGLKPLSGLAHRVEDLLDYLAEKQIDGNQNILELLQTSADCLSALASGESSIQLTNRITLLFTNFDQTLRSLEDGTFLTKADLQSSVEAGHEVLQEQTKSENQPPAGVHKPVVRVSLERLDELVRLVGDLVISRSVFEQRLAEFEHQIGELHDSTDRMVRSTNKLETDFEANMLSGNGAGSSPSAIRGPQTFDPLEFDRYTNFHQTTRELLETTGDASAVNTDLDKLHSNLELLFGNQSNLIQEMHDKLLRLRMVKFGSLSARLQRIVRVTCDEEKKQATLIIEGERTEVDTQILDLLVEPLLHLLRNAVAHGIEAPDTRRLLGKPEKGKIFLRLQSEGTQVILTVMDDGRGISAVALREKAVKNGFISHDDADQMSDEDAFSLSFLPGVTTAENISQTAGRGVGMNIIKTSILRGQGTISIASEPQKGTVFTIRMPMALAITRGLLVKTNGQTFAFPLKMVKKVSEISAEEFAKTADNISLTIDGVDFTVADLGALLNLPPGNQDKEFIPLLLVEALETPCALMVEEIVRAEEIVIKPLAAPLQNYPNLLGATILGDGDVVPVLDLIYLLKNRILNSRFRVPGEDNIEMEFLPAEPENPLGPTLNSRLLKVMIVDDSPSVRHITSKIIKNAGWEVILAKDGLDALETLRVAETLPDVVLTDAEMPRMDGYELLSAVKSNKALDQLPIIMITSRAGEKHRQKAVELGVSGYLTKPFDDSFLIETIGNLAQPNRLP